METTYTLIFQENEENLTFVLLVAPILIEAYDIFSEAHGIKVRKSTCSCSISTTPVYRHLQPVLSPTTNLDILIKQMSKMPFLFHVA